MSPMSGRSLAGLTLASLLAVTVTGCTNGSAGADQSPEEVLAAAKTELDETSGVHVSLATEKLPPAVDGILSAEGVGTHDPAFDGELVVATGGITADVSVVAVDGTVYAKLPFTSEFVEIDPASYSAPDPAALMRPEGGLSSLLTAAEGLEEGDPVREKEQVLTEYTGTVPGDAVATIIPSAAPTSDFDATFTVADDDRLAEAELTGPFYPEADDVTYTISFDEYGTTQDITAP